MIEYDFLISGILMRFQVPKSLKVPDNFQPFQIFRQPTIHTTFPEMVLEVTIQSSNLEAGCHVSQPQKKEAAPQCVHYQLTMNEQEYQAFSECGHWLNFMKFGELIFPYRRVILHASAILYDQKAYLFIAPSGGGKSTQANLWRRYFHTEILNGDKVILEIRRDKITAYGSPVAGSSGIYNNNSAPLGGIFVVKKADMNRLVQVEGFRKLLILYGAVVKSGDNEKINEALLDELKIVSEKVPIYHYYCTKEKGAAYYLRREMFGE